MISHIAAAIGGAIIGGLIVRKNVDGANALVARAKKIIAWVKAKVFKKKASASTTSDTTTTAQ